MKDSELNIDLTCHVLYSKPCKAQIQSKIALHYPEGEQEAIWTRVQKQYAAFLSGWRTDLGGAKNFHNGAGGNYDCVALMAYYVVCKDVTSLQEIEEMEGTSSCRRSESSASSNSSTSTSRFAKSSCTARF